MSDKDYIKMILLNLDEVSDIQFKRLMDVFGEDLIRDAVKELSSNNDTLLKVGRFAANLYVNSSLVKGMKPAYGYYIDDIDSISDLNLDKKNDLLIQIANILKRLNKLLDKVDGMETLKDSKVAPWVSDKVEYSINVCTDIELLNKIRKLYDEYIDKRNILLETYLKFVMMIAKNYCRDGGISIEDLIQYGNMGLIRAIEMYDISQDKTFLTYAGYWVHQGIVYNSKKMLCNYKAPTRLYDLNIKRVRALENLTMILGRNPSDEELANFVGVTVLRLNEIRDLFSEPLSSEDLMYEEIDDIDNFSDEVSNLIVSDNDFEIDRDLIEQEMSSELEKYMNLCLDDREIDILKSRFGFTDEMISVTKLAEMYGVSASRLYEIIQKAYGKLCKN